MTVAEMMEDIAYAELDILIVTPAGRVDFHFGMDHLSEDEDMFYMEDIDGRPFELNKDSAVKLENDGTYNINKGDCLICIKLSA